MAIAMRATRAFSLGGVAYEPGQAFTTNPVQAAALRYQHKAEFARRSKAPPGAPAPTAEAPVPDEAPREERPRSRGRFRRQDPPPPIED